MLTINEYKEKHNLTNSQLGELIGASRQTVAKLLMGAQVTRDTGIVLKKIRELGILPPGITREQYESAFDSNVPKTLREFYETSGMTIYQIAEMLGTNTTNVFNWVVKGKAAKQVFVEKMNEFGIVHPVYVRERPKPVEEVNKVDEFYIRDGVLKPFQINAVKKFGNTVVTAVCGKEKIIEEFAEHDLKVICRAFETHDDRIHYIVERI